ncbi:MAG TPA: hypothetical protein VFY95_05320 [Sphingomicrobium sp.]
MNASTYSRRAGWSARLLIGLVLILAGAAAATWALARYQPAARFLGVVPASSPTAVRTAAPAPALAATPRSGAETAAEGQRVTELETRVSRVENATERAEGSAGRADALVVAFAARRAIDRGVALGYLENLLVDRFGDQHQRAVGTIIAASHQPVRLNDLIAEYEALGPELRRGGPEDSWWTNLQREIGSLVEIHRADRPSPSANARYERAMQRLSSGDVDRALAETMRLPGAARASGWVAKARRYVAAHRALDEIESAALLGGR